MNNNEVDKRATDNQYRSDTISKVEDESLEPTEHITVQLIDPDEVSDLFFPFFTSYRMYIDENIKIYGFFLYDELIAVSAVIPNDPENKSGFITYGSPIIYVFEVRKDMQKRGYGKKCAELLVNNVIKEDSIQLSCTPFVAGFWQKVGFEIRGIDQTMYMHTMLLEKGKMLEKEKG